MFKQHFPTKAAMLAYAAKELKIPGVRIEVSWDAKVGMWCCETTHKRGCQCGGCK